MSIKVVIGEVRFSYVNVWEPKAIEGSNEARYSTCVLIPKSDVKTVQQVQQAIESAKKEGLAKFGGKMPSNLKLPLRDGDTERSDDENFRNCYFLNANCRYAPGVVDRHRKPILDTTEFYSGCYGYVRLNFYAFHSNGNKGVACGLNNIMKSRDGNLLGGRSSAEDDFKDIEITNDNDYNSYNSYHSTQTPHDIPKGFSPVNEQYDDLPF